MVLITCWRILWFGVHIDCLLRSVDRTCQVLRLWRWVKGYGMAFGNSGCLRMFDIFDGELSKRFCLPSLTCSSGKWWMKVFTSSVVTQMKIVSMLCGYVIRLSPFGCLISIFPFLRSKRFSTFEYVFRFLCGEVSSKLVELFAMIAWSIWERQNRVRKRQKLWGNDEVCHPIC